MIDGTLKPNTLIKLITILGFLYPIPTHPRPIPTAKRHLTGQAQQEVLGAAQIQALEDARILGLGDRRSDVVPGKLTVFLYEKIVFFHSFLYVTYDKMVMCHSFLYVYQRLRKMTLRITIIMGGGW